MCGTRIGEGNVIQVEKDAGRARTDGLNDIKFEETTKSRSASATLTDEGLAHLSDALVAFVTGGHGIRTARISKAATRIVTPTNDRQLLLLDKTTEPVDAKYSTDQQDIIDSDNESADRVDEQSREDSKAVETDQEKLHRLFRYDGERIHPDEPHLKADSKGDYRRRLTLLFLYAHQLEGRQRVRRSDLNEILTYSTVYDSNAPSFIIHHTGLAREGDLIGLNLAGQREAKTALDEALDQSLVDGWLPGAGRTRPTRASGAEDSGTESGPRTSGRRSSRVPKDVADWMTKWKQVASNIDGHSAIINSPLQEKGVFGLWAIRKAAGDAGRVVSRGKLTRFLYEAFSIKVDERNLARKLESNALKGKVLKVAGGYEITPSSMQDGDKIARAAKATASKP